MLAKYLYETSGEAIDGVIKVLELRAIDRKALYGSGLDKPTPPECLQQRCDRSRVQESEYAKTADVIVCKNCDRLISKDFIRRHYTDAETLVHARKAQPGSLPQTRGLHHLRKDAAP